MKLCRYDFDRLGVLVDDVIRDVSPVLDTLPRFRWARPLEDPVIARLETLRPSIEAAVDGAPVVDRRAITLNAPVANPSKIIGAPVNYHAHMDEARADNQIHHGQTIHPIDEIGCFLKAGSALVGPDARIDLPFTDARVDHEGEIAVVIGRAAAMVQAANAMDYIAGYALALDMTVRGKQDRSMRKSCDGFAVLGSWLTTADEIADPAAIAFELRINGEIRQSAHTGMLIRSIAELIEMCSAFYTLLPGDVIMTGTPAGVSQVASGDRIDLSSEQLGHLSVTIQ